MEATKTLTAATNTTTTAKCMISLPKMVTLCWKLVFRRREWNIILENNISQKEGETHYNLAYDLVFVGADRIGR
jgi:hypothetical protein